MESESRRRTRSTVESSKKAFDEKLAGARSHETEFLGLSQEQASSLADQLGIVLRVRLEGQPITLDWHPGRVTVVLSFGVVIESKAG